MKVLLLGAGTMGKGGIRALEHFSGVESVTIGDLNYDVAKEFADDINFPETNAVEIDVTDSEKLTELARDYDVVFNAVGPFMRFGVPILEAVIEAGTDYVDVCDDGDATADLLDLHDKAKEAGVTALIGCGQTPGVSNMQAKQLADKLDRVDSIKIAWGTGVPPVEMLDDGDLPDDVEAYDANTTEEFIERNPSAWEHMVHSTTGEVDIWRDGKYDTIPAWDSGEYFDFAEPYGRVPVFYVGHPEPVTLPMYIDIKDFAACLGHNTVIQKDLRKESRGHYEPLDPPVDPGTPLWTPPDKWQDKGVWQGQGAIVEGIEDGEKVRYTSRYMCSVYDRGAYTFAGQGIGVYLIGSTEDREKGAFAPEGILEEDEFFDALVMLTNEMNDWDFTLEELVPIEKEVIK